MRNFTSEYGTENAINPLVAPFEAAATEAMIVDPAEETCRVQADGFLGTERGFHDVERLWRQRQQQN